MIRPAQTEGEERFLALDVAVEGALGDTDRLGDIRHLGEPVAARDEDLGRGVDQVVETVLGNAAGHQGRPAGACICARAGADTGTKTWKLCRGRKSKLSVGR